ncbi:gliding motility protein GldL [Xylanibacter muris]|uniref:type IX secretion system motor protein PorL/GldL n=1 Tax=Xylanibacter muris TaxID=2736290 RepID=UPI0025A05A62|nr:gliding motility protein GldL [Xylanibacter muris]
MFNLAYSWGACLVIMGAVFKISHFPYDDLFLLVGMVTEVVVFFITGFDAPPEEYKWERAFPMLRRGKGDKDSADNGGLLPDDIQTIGIRKKLEEMEEHIDAMNKIFEKQVGELKAQMDVVTEMGRAFDKIKAANNGTLENSGYIQRETKDVAEKIAALNSQYSRMLEAMNIKSGSK